MSEAPVSSTETIYVPLLDEGLPVVRPTLGRPLGDGAFFLLAAPGYDPRTEHWEFLPGSVVKCVWEHHEGEAILVAREQIGPAVSRSLTDSVSLNS